MIEETAASSKARRRADLALVGTYHEARLAELLETVRDGFARYDAGESDAFELDDLIHRYKRATRELWKLCGNITGSSAHFVARTIEDLDGNLIAGSLPRRALGLVVEWAQQHRDELEANWERARRAEALEPVDPLP